MADPLSIAASVAGLVSLGFQVVGGITQYLDAVRERKGDVASAKTHVFRTQELLKRVEVVAARVEPTHGTTAAFLRGFASVQPELQVLDNFVQSLDSARASSSNHEICGKVYAQAKKLTYPFHRPTMDRLESGLVRLNGMLQSAIQVSGVDVAINTDSNVSAIKASLPDMARQLSVQIEQGHLAHQYSVAHVGDSVVSLSNKFDQGFNILEDIATTSVGSMSAFQRDLSDNHARLFQQLSATRSDVSNLNDAFKRLDMALRARPLQEFGRLISKPSQLRELCDTMEATPSFTTFNASSPRSRIDLVRSKCICQKRVSRSRQSLLWGPWQAVADTTTTHIHLPGCIYYNQNAAVPSKRWAVRFTGLQKLVNRAIEVSFSYSFGAGGCSLSPTFNYYPTVDRKRDPAFRIMALFSRGCARFYDDEDLDKLLEQCLDKMALLYRWGKASPKAVDRYGRGVLHYLNRLSINPTTSSRLLTGLDSLIKHGVQSTIYDIHGATPAWTMRCASAAPWLWDTPYEIMDPRGPDFTFYWVSPLLNDFLCAQGPGEAIVTKSVLEFPPDHRGTLELFTMMKRSPKAAEAFGCGPLSLAALQGNFQKMEFLLTNYPNTINELNLLKQTPLHLAVRNPSCVALLLSRSDGKLIDLPDSGGRRPLEYALYCSFVKRESRDHYHGELLASHGDTSLGMLLDAGCMIPKLNSWSRDAFASQRYDSPCEDCLQAVSAHLVDRRQQLKSLAAHNLTRTQAATLGVFSPYVLDSDATRIIQALDERGIVVPPSLQVSGCGCDALASVYHGYGPFSFSTLWSLGFRDLDIPDSDGLTPLMSLCKPGRSSLETRDAGRCAWLVQNGADLWKLIPDGTSTVGHQLYSKFGEIYDYSHDDSDDNSDDDADDDSDDAWDDELERRRNVVYLTERLAHQDPRDGCHCTCSPGGCTPFIRFIQTAHRWRHYRKTLEFVQELPDILLESHTSITKAQMKSAVRYVTFECLGIRHTCCHNERIDASDHDGELDELRREDRYLVAYLEDLTTEFEMELERMSQERYVNKSVSFWHGYWLPRMQQALESIESAEIEQPDINAAEDIGVVWHMQESGKGKDRDVDGDTYFDNGSEYGGYHESDWDSEVDESHMFDTFRTMDDWTARLDSIMAKAGMPAGL